MLYMDNKHLLIRVVGLLFKYKYYYAIIFISIIIHITLSIAQPYIMQQLVDNAIFNGNIQLLIKLCISIIIITLIDMIINVTTSYLSAKIGKRLSSNLRIESLHHLSKLSGRYFTNTEPGEIFVTLYGDINTIESISTTLLFSYFSDFFTAVGITIYLAINQWDLLLFVLILQPMIVILQTIFQKRITAKTEELRNVFAKLTALLDERISNMLSHIVNKTHKFFFEKYIPVEEQQIDCSIKIETIRSINSGILSTLSALIAVGILGYGGYKVITGAFTLGGVMAFSTYSQKLFSPLMSVATNSIQLRQAMVSVKRVYKLLDEPIEIQEDGEQEAAAKINGHVLFDNVSFGYTQDTMVLKNIILELNAGETTGIIGKSGCGKSTLTHLLYRLWDVNGGSISIGGINIKRFGLNDLRSNITIVSQDAYLFDDTIYNNVSLGDPAIQESDVWCALKYACFDNHVRALPDKLGTYIGEGGIRLSGGEKQRIAIARALLSSAPILIFDESTSALDILTEKTIMNNIRNRTSQQTVIIITHRLINMIEMDSIHLLKNGTVYAHGTHADLIRTSDYYRILYNKAFQEATEG